MQSAPITLIYLSVYLGILKKSFAPNEDRTHDLSFTRRAPYHLAIEASESTGEKSNWKVRRKKLWKLLLLSRVYVCACVCVSVCVCMCVYACVSVCQCAFVYP